MALILMDMVIRVEWNQTGLRRRVETWMKRQIPFVLKRALNRTILEARAESREELPGSFTIRNRRTSQGVRVSLASKSDLTASFGTIDEYMRLQIFGGKPEKQLAEAIPMQGRGKGRPRKTSKTTRSRWPGALKRKRGGFYKPGRKNAQLLFLPRGKRLLLAYVILPEIKVKPSGWDIEATLARVAKAEWRDNVEIAWNKAIRTARR